MNSNNKGSRGSIWANQTHSGPDKAIFELSSSSNTKHSGTETNQPVRNFVNDPKTPVPDIVGLTLKYRSDNKAKKIRSIEVENPLAPKYDAGHKNGRQNGGSGTDFNNIFPQNPIVNRFPKKGKQYTIDANWVSHKHSTMSWRDMEDKINRKIVKYGQDVTVEYNALSYHGGGSATPIKKSKNMIQKQPVSNSGAFSNSGLFSNSTSGPLTRLKRSQGMGTLFNNTGGTNSRKKK